MENHRGREVIHSIGLNELESVGWGRVEFLGRIVFEQACALVEAEGVGPLTAERVGREAEEAFLRACRGGPAG